LPVVGIEHAAAVTLATFHSTFAIDRVDAIGDAIAIIDYKTGHRAVAGIVVRCRPRRPGSFGLYRVSPDAAIVPNATCTALAYAQLRPGDPKVVGVATESLTWPGSSPLPATRIAADWTALLAWCATT